MLYLLENSIRSNSFYFTHNKDLTGKVILQVEYLYDVWVNEWSVVCVHSNLPWLAQFQFQASHDGKTLVDIGNVMATEKVVIKSMMNVENQVEWVFPNPEHVKETKYKYWRAMGTSGKSQSGYISLLFMNIQ